MANEETNYGDNLGAVLIVVLVPVFLCGLTWFLFELAKAMKLGAF